MNVVIKFWNNRKGCEEERIYYCVNEVRIEVKGNRKGSIKVNGIEIKV